MTVVSGGAFCLPAIMLRDNGLRAESMPFDWLFCNVQSLIWILQSDFRYFLDPDAILSIAEQTGRPSATNKYYDNGNIERPFFNHKDPTRAIDKEHYERCIRRFLSLRGTPSTLFVFEEFGELDRLYQPLIETLDHHMPGMCAYAVSYRRTEQGPNLKTMRVDGGHALIELSASKIVDGSGFERPADQVLLLTDLASRLHR